MKPAEPFETWEYLDTIGGSVNADILKGLFEAQGIEVQLFQEAVGKIAYPGTFGLVNDVDVYVKASDLQRARELLDEINAQLSGASEMELPINEDSEEGELPGDEDSG